MVGWKDTEEAKEVQSCLLCNLDLDAELEETPSFFSASAGICTCHCFTCHCLCECSGFKWGSISQDVSIFLEIGQSVLDWFCIQGNTLMVPPAAVNGEFNRVPFFSCHVATIALAHKLPRWERFVCHIYDSRCHLVVAFRPL